MGYKYEIPCFSVVVVVVVVAQTDYLSRFPHLKPKLGELGIGDWDIQVSVKQTFDCIRIQTKNKTF